MQQCQRVIILQEKLKEGWGASGREGKLLSNWKSRKMTFTTDVSIKRGELYTLRPPFTRKNVIHSDRTDDNCLLSTVIPAFKKSKKVSGK